MPVITPLRAAAICQRACAAGKQLRKRALARTWEPDATSIEIRSRCSRRRTPAGCSHWSLFAGGACRSRPLRSTGALLP